MKSVVKRVILILIVLILLFCINTKTYAWSEIIGDGKDFISTGQSGDTSIPIDSGSLQDASGYLYNILLSAGVIIAVIVAAVLGVQFVMGGAEEQAKIKEMIIPFVVGCIIVFGGFGFWKVAVTIGQNFEATGGTGTPQSITPDDGGISQGGHTGGGGER